MSPSRPAARGPRERMTPDAVAAIAVLLLTAFAMMLNETSLAVALPAIMADFDVPASTAQWLLTGVMLTMAIVMPATGWAIDRFPTRRLYFASVGVFLVGIVVAALSPTFGIMLVGRILQAVGTAVVMPLLMTVVMTVVPVGRRGAVMGLISVVLAVGPALGPTYAGLMMSLGHWHFVYWGLVPVVVGAAAVGLVKLTDVTARRDTPLDVPSLVLAAFAFGGLVHGLASVGRIVAGVGTDGIVALGVGAVGTVLFVLRQVRRARTGTALLDLAPFRVRNFTVALIAMLLVQFVLLGVANLLPLYLQGALLTTAMVAGLVNLPGGIIETLLSPLSGVLHDRVGPRPVVVPALAVMTGALVVLAGVDEKTAVWQVVVIFAVLSVGIAMALTPLATTALGSLPKHLYSHGSAIDNTLLQVFGAAGTAVTMAVYSYRGETGGGTRAALADGAAAAFGLCALLCGIALVVALFLRTPPREDVTALLD